MHRESDDQVHYVFGMLFERINATKIFNSLMYNLQLMGLLLSSIWCDTQKNNNGAHFSFGNIDKLIRFGILFSCILI
jgi:hypothetical protein